MDPNAIDRAWPTFYPKPQPNARNRLRPVRIFQPEGRIDVQPAATCLPLSGDFAPTATVGR